MKKRPLAVTIIGWIYIATGIAGIVYHARQFNLQHPFESDAMVALSVRALAIVAGAFMLRGQDWARWLAVAWMGFHVILSIYHPLSQLVIHAVSLVLLAFFLFRPEARQYFLNTTGTTE
jgi:uncharacterized protein YhhL (DUF1145 family)